MKMSITPHETLSVNEAGLYIQIHSKSEPVEWSLWARATECYECYAVPCKPAVINTSFFKFNAHYNWILELHNKTDNTTFTRDVDNFTELNIYEWHYINEHENFINLCKSITDPDALTYAIVSVLIICSLLVIHKVSKVWSQQHSAIRRIVRSLSTIEEIENDLGSPEDANALIAAHSNTVPRASHNRVKSLDVFRGITIFSMIFVDYGGGCYWFFEHSEWNGLTFADVVFPWFAWIMGVGTAVKVKSELRNSTDRMYLVLKIAKRSFIMISLGVFLSNIKNNDLSTIRLPGVLQRLGLAYFIVGAIEASFMTPQLSSENSQSKFLDIKDCWKQWIIVSVLVVIHTCLTFLLPIPPCPTGYLGPGGETCYRIHENCTGGAAAYIDKLVFTESHLYREPTCKELYNCKPPYDPEGLLGVLTTVLCVYFGVHAARILQVYKGSSQRITRWILSSAICILGALMLCCFSVNDGLIPVNKNLWSLSYVLMCSGLAFFVFSLLYIVIDTMKWWKGSPFYQTGMNSLLLYAGHVIFANILPWRWQRSDPKSHMECLFASLWATALWILIALVLYRRKIFLAI